MKSRRVPPPGLRRRLALGLIFGPWLAQAGGAGTAQEAFPRVEGRTEVVPGLVLERVLAPATESVRRAPLVTLVRIDPHVFGFQLFTAQRYGRSRTPPEWLAEFGLTGVINASMYMPNLRSVALMVDGETVNNGYDHPAYEGYLAFGPKQEGLSPVVLRGRTCEGFDVSRLRQQYRVVIQNYRLLDCGGFPIAWQDRKLYSTAAVGLDDRGWVVFIHTGEPYRMEDLSRWLATDELGLVAAVFVEGGPAAALMVDVDGRRVEEVGMHEGTRSDRPGFRSVPNVIGFRPLTAE